MSPKETQAQELPPQILIVDDARDIREPLAKYLQQSGFRTLLASDAVDARKRLQSNEIDLVVLDVMMPGEDGLSLCRDLRAKSRLPIILLTAMAEETDRVVGLEVGADDYVTKPFSPRELVARIKSVLRRAQGPEMESAEAANSVLAFEGWRFFKARRELLDAGGVLVALSTAEIELLSVFLAHPKAILSRARLLDLAFSRQEGLFDRTIDNQVSRLRRKLGDTAKTPRLIKTVRGGGYIFTADVAVTAP
ncbi:MAG: response regulator transcription factor [Rhodospirillaceae bacterium]|nr:response regulator transcription factor [Rhodospirillaceae bacterium]